jgi:uncharacterized protein
VAANPWLVSITALKRSAWARRTEHRSGRVGRLSVAGSTVPADAEVTADAQLDAVDGGIEVTADVSAPWTGECRRCLRPIEARLEVHVRELYRLREHEHRRKGHGHAGRDGPDDRHVRPEGDEDEDTYPLHGEMLDLQPLVRDALMLELPLAPVCSDSCKGLCPRCGADLNDGPCDCDDAPADPRWAALGSLEAVEPGPSQGRTA